MGSAASVGGDGDGSLPEVLSKDMVKQRAGALYREDIFREVAGETATLTRRQFEHCQALAAQNLLRYVVVGRHGGGGSSSSSSSSSTSTGRRTGGGLGGYAPRLSAEEWSKRVVAAREAGRLLEAAVAAHSAFMVQPTPAHCLNWLRALHANGTTPGRLANLAQGWSSIYPDNAELAELLAATRRKVPHPFEEVEDQLYPLTEAERRCVDDLVDALPEGAAEVGACKWSGACGRWAAERQAGCE
jgi:hypothetical protein